MRACVYVFQASDAAADAQFSAACLSVRLCCFFRCCFQWNLCGASYKTIRMCRQCSAPCAGISPERARPLSHAKGLQAARRSKRPKCMCVCVSVSLRSLRARACDRACTMRERVKQCERLSCPRRRVGGGGVVVITPDYARFIGHTSRMQRIGFE